MIKKCPACNGETEFLTDWQYSGILESPFNTICKLYTCKVCGIVFNTSINKDKLDVFYEKECFYFENSHFDIENKMNIKKYKHYYNILQSFIKNDEIIVDVGCGRGGFIKYINKYHNKNCIGVDIDTKSLPVSAKGVEFKNESLTKLPFRNNTLNCLCYFSVLEHIPDLDILLSEAYRVLAGEGVIMIECPNSSKYSKYPVNTGFWPAIREHIIHFTPNSLILLLNRHGFTCEFIEETLMPTPEFVYPSLICVGVKNKRKNYIANSTYTTASFFINSQLAIKKRAYEIIKISNDYENTIFWGFSNTLLNILPICYAKLNYTICDASDIKQKLVYLDKKIESPHFSTNTNLFISSILHHNEIEQIAIHELKYKAEDIFKLI
jgi:ubiquinone/menaquinone biosynthesis C-methylase UbiE